nr:MAG TPA: hypothetical protein [Caudoviricetes sp.]
MQKKQNRNKIGILGYSSVFTFHLILFLAFGCTQSVSQSYSPHDLPLPQEYRLASYREFCSQKRK